jgi:hypothetical protein
VTRWWPSQYRDIPHDTQIISETAAQTVRGCVSRMMSRATNPLPPRPASPGASNARDASAERVGTVIWIIGATAAGKGTKPGRSRAFSGAGRRALSAGMRLDAIRTELSVPERILLFCVASGTYRPTPLRFSRFNGQILRSAQRICAGPNMRRILSQFQQLRLT